MYNGKFIGLLKTHLPWRQVRLHLVQLIILWVFNLEIRQRNACLTYVRFIELWFIVIPYLFDRANHLVHIWWEYVKALTCALHVAHQLSLRLEVGWECFNLVANVKLFCARLKRSLVILQGLHFNLLLEFHLLKISVILVFFSDLTFCCG
jgi:hypothetical protein